jgi:hypothetical protein
MQSGRKFPISVATRLAGGRKRVYFYAAPDLKSYSLFSVRCPHLMVVIKSNTLGRYHDKYIISIIKHKREGNIKYK